MNNWGGVRKGAGRPPSPGETRKNCTLKATTAEWDLILAFAKIVKHGQCDVATSLRDLTDKVIEHCSRVQTDDKSNKTS